jgi:hypothetical protein
LMRAATPSTVPWPRPLKLTTPEMPPKLTTCQDPVALTLTHTNTETKIFAAVTAPAVDAMDATVATYSAAHADNAMTATAGAKPPTKSSWTKSTEKSEKKFQNWSTNQSPAPSKNRSDQ